MDIKKTLKSAISEAISKLDLEAQNIEITSPVYEQHGDYSTNTALKSQILNPKLQIKNPRELAQKIVEELKRSEELKHLIYKIEIAGPGFINFWIKEEILLKELKRIADGQIQLKNNDLTGKKVMVEYTDPNPFKEFHIGHLYSNTVGESLARLYEALGAEVKRANYQGDVGMHVAKSIWGMMELLKEENTTLADLEKKSLADRQKFLGNAYTAGANAYEDSAAIKSEIEAINKKIYDLDPSIKNYYDLGRKWSLEYFETIYQRLGTMFDYYFFERETGKEGLNFVKTYLDKGIFQKSEGAVVFEGKPYGLHTRVFINSLGLPTYEAKDLGLAPTKYAKFPYDLSLIITGNEINEYFKVILKVLSLINLELSKKTVHLGHGMVRVPSGKMSSRKGNILTGEWLLEETKKQAENYLTSSNKKPEEIVEISEAVAISAVKYSLLKNSIGRDIIFDFKESLSLEGNSGPYLLYTYARAKSILRKVQNSEFIIKNYESQLQITNYKLQNEELSILRSLIKFPETVYEAGKNFSPNIIANYLFDLAQKFNLFYQKVPILNAKEEEKHFRLLLTQATANTIKKGLDLLGIKVLERM